MYVILRDSPYFAATSWHMYPRFDAMWIRRDAMWAGRMPLNSFILERTLDGTCAVSACLTMSAALTTAQQTYSGAPIL